MGNFLSIVAIFYGIIGRLGFLKVRGFLVYYKKEVIDYGRI